MLFRYTNLTKTKKTDSMVRLFICCAVVVATAALNGAEIRIAQHRMTLFPNKEELPVWWPDERRLKLVKGIFQFLFALTAFANCVIVTLANNPVYIINFGILILFLWPSGKLLGIGLMSGIIRLKGKKHDIYVPYECLWKTSKVFKFILGTFL